MNLASRESDTGTMVFEINYDKKYFEVMLVHLATEHLVKRAYSSSARR